MKIEYLKLFEENRFQETIIVLFDLYQTIFTVRIETI